MGTSLKNTYRDDLRALLDRPDFDVVRMNAEVLRLAAKQRLELLKGWVQKRSDGVLLYGPFKGMRFVHRISEGCYLPKLYGFYEAELHPVLEQLAATRRYQAILDVGAAEGYYAVGLARLFPEAHVHAHDTYTSDHILIHQLAQLNDVQDRLTVGSFLHPEDFSAFYGQSVLVFCDIEGGEKELLDPARAPELAGMDVIVEMHPFAHPDIEAVLMQRFSATHTLMRIDEQPRSIGLLPDYFRDINRLDQLLAIWEYRSSPTPWMVMFSKQPAG